MKRKKEEEKKELVEKIHKLEDSSHFHHVDITALKEKNDELYKQGLYLEKVMLEKEQQLKKQQSAVDREKETIRRQYEDERRLRKEEEDKLAVEVSQCLGGPVRYGASAARHSNIR